MRLLLLTHAFNCLSQRLYVELAERGHEVTVELDVNHDVTREALELARPDLVLAPYLRRALPAEIFQRCRCLIVHPGPPGDRGPSALDRAILDGERAWGVTVLQAEAELDAGPIWGAAAFPMRAAPKSSLYRNEVTDAAVAAVLDALGELSNGGRPRRVSGRFRPALRAAERAIDWTADDTETVLRKIRSADGAPGAKDALGEATIELFDAHPADALAGRPGELLARSGGAVARATRDGAVWLGHLRERQSRHPFKLPAGVVLGTRAAHLPEREGAPVISYEERGEVGLLHFPFYNGAMSTAGCRELLAAYRRALARPTRVLLLLGGPDVWSNGLHLNLIEAADSPAEESLRNIEAMDELALAIITTCDRLTVAALQGNAGAGGVFLALAADAVWARAGVVLNPHYKGMGNLYGSEYWTYLLPRRMGEETARRITEARLPIGTAEALRLGLIDARFGDGRAAFLAEALLRAEALAADVGWALQVEAKRRRREADEAERPLAAYRAAELERMKLSFFGFDPSYHVARYNFVHKVPKSRTPLSIAAHRRGALDR